MSQIGSWSFAYRSSVDIKSLSIPNGDQVPLPPRSMWSGGARIIASLLENEGQKSYYVTITKDVYLETESEHMGGVVKNQGPGMVAKGLARKFATSLGGGVLGGVVGGLVGVLIPSDITTEKFWRSQTSAGIPVTIVMLGF